MITLITLLLYIFIALKWKKIYHHKAFPRIFYLKPDGGKDSGVTAFFLIEWKWLLSIGILYFKRGTREAYHTHAFNALTWWIMGKVTEETIDLKHTDYKPSPKPKLTLRNNFHRVIARRNTLALTFRGPWVNTWKEFRIKTNQHITLTHGRKEI